MINSYGINVVENVFGVKCDERYINAHIINGVEYTSAEQVCNDFKNGVITCKADCLRGMFAFGTAVRAAFHMLNGRANGGECNNAWRKFIGEPMDSQRSSRGTRTRTQVTTASGMNYNDRTFGIEFECGFKEGKFSTKDKAVAYFKKVCTMFGLSVIGAGTRADHTDSRSAWKLDRDGSLNEGVYQGYEHMVEVVSPILKGEDGWNQLEKMCAVFKLCNMGVNDKCGTHIHLGAKDLAWENYQNVVINYNMCKDAYESIIQYTRTLEYLDIHDPYENRRWAKYYSDSQMKEIKNYTCFDDIYAYGAICHDVIEAERTGWHYPQSRYYAVNMVAYYQRKTIEFRAHGGTVEYAKISSWLKAHMELIAWSANNRIETAVANVENMPWLSAESKQNFVTRALISKARKAMREGTL